MTLYIIKRKEDRYDWDNAVAFVVRADSPSQARTIASENCGDEGKDFWLDEESTSCNMLWHMGPPGLILRDFNAG